MALANHGVTLANWHGDVRWRLYVDVGSDVDLRGWCVLNVGVDVDGCVLLLNWDRDGHWHLRKQQHQHVRHISSRHSLTGRLAQTIPYARL